METLADEIVVVDIAGKRAVVSCGNPTRQRELLDLGFIQDGTNFTRKINDKSDRENISRELIKMDALFSSGNDWSPAELLELYREQGLITSVYRVIHWKGPGKYTITTERVV